MKRLFSSLVFSLCSLFISMNANAQITVSGSTGANGPYTTFTLVGGVFDALNLAGSQSGNDIVITISADVLTETGAIALNAKDWTTITINPSGGAARTISGTSVAGSPLIGLNGADNVTIDGLNTAGNSLTISNSSTSSTPGTSTIRFINGAKRNTITNCTILGSSGMALGIDGGTIFFSTDALTPDGNDSNTVSNSNIGPEGASLPDKAIFSLGSFTTAAIRNSENLINNNNIFDFFGTGPNTTAGINIVSGNDNWTISNNRIYQTAARVFTAGVRYAGIILNTITLPGAFTISGNRIGFANSAGTGTTAISGLANEFRGIDAISTSTTTVTNITGNTISGITQTSSRASTVPENAAFIAVAMGVVDGLIDATLNNIGSLDSSSTIELTATSTTVSTAPAVGLFNYSNRNTVITNNNIGFITIMGTGTRTGFIGIDVNTFSGMTATINEDTISNITDTQVGTYTMYGIRITSAAASIVNNIVRNMTGNANAGSPHIVGIRAQTTGDNNIEKNQIFNLQNTAGIATGAINGIMVLFPATTNEIKQNYVYGLSATSTSTTYQINGIVRLVGAFKTGGSANVYNNMISLGLRTDGTSITTGFNIRGINDPGFSDFGSWNFYYNSVYIGGSGVTASASNSYAISSVEVTNPRDFINNIFWNDRSNAVGGGARHFAIQLGGVGPNPAGLTSDYNDLFASGTDGAVGFYDGANRVTLADWQLATGQDANSSSVTVGFVSPATGNLHLDGSSVGDEDFIATPLAGITTDIDKQPRDPVFPYMGADEGTEALPVELTSFTSSISGRDVTLNWATATETNNSGFDIERQDKRSETQNVWIKTGFVNGNGTVNSPSNYSFTDRGLSSGNYYYRLKQIDYNGNFQYFNLGNEVNVGIPTKYNLTQNYPNPFNPSTKINYDLPFDSKVSIKLFDMSGRQVLTIVNETMTAGYYSVNFNGSNLSSGVYFYSLSANNFTATKKMLLVK